MRSSITYASLIVLITISAVHAAVFYVNPTGDDNRRGLTTDMPLATLERAVSLCRAQPNGTHEIVLSEGRYFLKEMLTLDQRDQGLVIRGAGAGKTVIYAGRHLTGWVKKTDKLWYADLPSELANASFRVLLANDRILPRARFPEKGYLQHESRFPVRWMSSAGGGWERPPTNDEYTRMIYHAGDIPTDLRIENAEITICHMWDQSTLLIAAHNSASRQITFQDRGAHPPGAFGKHDYVIWNTREGMTKPGQWYLDKVEKRVYYYPRSDENIESITIIAPISVTAISLDGSKERSGAHNVTIRDLSIMAGDAPMTLAGFGGSKWPGVINANKAAKTTVERVEIANSGVWAVRGADLQIKSSHLHHLGGGAIKYWGTALIEGNHIHDIGLVSANFVGINGGGKSSVVRRNIIHDTPYSGMAVGGEDTLIEENVIFRCMQVHYDGAAIYMGAGQRCMIRRNIVRDMIQKGSGYGVSAYYLDEKCQECVVAENIAINVPHPTQNHMTLNCELRDNLFICEGDMKLAFPRCSGHKVSGNKFHLSGKINLIEADAVTEWQNNLFYIINADGGQVLTDFPRSEFTPREKPRYFNAAIIKKAPIINGQLDHDEWPAGGTSLAERPTQRSVRGAPISAKLVADNTHLYLLVNVVAMFSKQRRTGAKWGHDEGVELTIEQKIGDESHLHVLRGFTDGSLRPAEIPGVTSPNSPAFTRNIRYAADMTDKLWRSEWAVPLKDLGIDPSKKSTIAFNLTIYRSEDDVYAQFAGTLGETWDLTRGGRVNIDLSKGL